MDVNHLIWFTYVIVAIGREDAPMHVQPRLNDAPGVDDGDVPGTRTARAWVLLCRYGLRVSTRNDEDQRNSTYLQGVEHGARHFVHSSAMLLALHSPPPSVMLPPPIALQ
jgi:hypothetical protein